jgi:CRISPR type IV-associated protein Csf3
MIPLRIDITLSTPMVVPDRPLHLDSLLAWSVFRLASKSGAEDPLAAIHELPLERHQVGDAWVWKASQFDLETEGGIFWNHHVRRFDMNQWAEDRERGVWEGRKEVIPIGTGPQKAFSFVQAVVLVRRATAWCIGDADIVTALLRDEVYALGRKSGTGWGRVRTIEVTPAPAEEADHWRRRALPQAMEEIKLPGHFAGTAAVIPPYWDRRGWQPAWEFDASALVPA